MATPLHARAAIRIALTCLLAFAPAAVAATFEPLPHPDGLRSEPVAASGDGRVLLVNVFQAPTSGHIPSSYRWNDGVVETLPCIFATDMSDDGKTVTASCQNAVAERRLWVDGALVDLPAGYRHTILTAVSGDGLVVFGTLAYEYCQTEDLCYDPAQAFRLANGVAQDLGFLPGDHQSVVVGASLDGSVAAFRSRLQDITPSNEEGPFAMDLDHAARWKASALPQGSLLPLDPSAEESVVTEISSDGTTLVGNWYRWTEASGLVYLDILPDTDWAEANGVSGDGKVIVGAYENPAHPNGRASIWRQETGTLDLQDLLVDDLGVDLDGWELLSATDISSDASTIIGVGIDPASGLVSGWRVGLTDPAIVVTVTGDEPNDPASTAANECDADLEEPEPQCTLRAAIELANDRGGATIKFDIDSDGVPRIDVPAEDEADRLPAFTAPIVLDGTTQPGGWVELVGPGQSRGDVPVDNDPIIAGIEASPVGGGSTIRGLVIHGFRDAGVVLRMGADDCVIEGNRIGTDVTGTEWRGNGDRFYASHGDVLPLSVTAGGVEVYSSRNVIRDNVLAGNVWDNETSGPGGINGEGGTDLFFGPTAFDNRVEGNRIGVGADGAVLVVPDLTTFDYEYIGIGAVGGGNLVIGGDATGVPGACIGTCNLVAGHQVEMWLSGWRFDESSWPGAVGVTVEGNHLGVDAAGTMIPPRHPDKGGIYLGDVDESATPTNNRVAYNRVEMYGLFSVNAIAVGGVGDEVVGNVVRGNPDYDIGSRIGINFVGIRAIGRGVTVRGNDVSANTRWGITAGGTGTVVEGNEVAGNPGGGIYASGDSVTVTDNHVHDNAIGVLVDDGGEVRIRTNRIYDNAIGIDLSRTAWVGDGVTPNDYGDGDDGGNGLQNFPNLLQATLADGTLTVSGFISTPLLESTTYTVDAYLSTGCRSDAHYGGMVFGQGESFFYGFQTTSSLGEADVDFVEGRVTPGYTHLSMTATRDEGGATSEFSRCLPLAAPGDVASADVPADASGSVLDDRGVTVTVSVGSVSAAVRRAVGNATSGMGKLFVTRYEHVPEGDVIADLIATGVGGTAVRPEAVAARYWYLADRKLTPAGGATASLTFDVCLDPTGVVRPPAMRTVVIVRRDEGTRGAWVPHPTTHRLHGDTVHLCAAGLDALGEFGFGGASAAFSTGPADACDPAPAGIAGGRCACDLLPPLACDTLPKSVAKPAEIACGKLAQASVETKAKKQKKLVKGAKAGFKKALKKLGGKAGRELPDACRAALTATLRNGQARLE